MGLAIAGLDRGARSDHGTTIGHERASKLWLAVNTYIVVAITICMFFVLPAPEYLLLGLFLLAAGNVVFGSRA